MVAGAKEAAARPAIATSRANMRMAVVIFGNLVEFEFGKDAAISRQDRILNFSVSLSFSLC
jgi:hypothetical protein